MKKQSAKTVDDNLRNEYDLSLLKGGVRGKYHRKASAGTNLVLIEPDLANLFPDSESVNRALVSWPTLLNWLPGRNAHAIADSDPQA